MIKFDWTNREEVMAAVKKWPRVIDQEARSALDVFAELIVSEVVQRTPVGLGSGPWGHLANSIQAGDAVKNPMTGWQVEWGTPCEYAEPIEYGRSPGTMPPVDALAEWVMGKPGFNVKNEKQARQIAYAIALRIKERGYANHPEGWQMFQEGLEAARPQLDPILRQMRLNIERRASLGS